MRKIRKKNNTLIKRAGLIKELHKAGVKRISKKALSSLEKTLNNNIKGLISFLIEELTIEGRKTLKEKDIKKIALRTKEAETSGWEI